MGARGTAFASDLDGTLCVSDWDKGTEEFDERNLEAIRHYQQAGGLFGICTGRPLKATVCSLEGMVDPDFYIVSTGAQVFDGDLNPIFSRGIDRTVVSELVSRYGQHHDMHVVVLSDDDFFVLGRPLASMQVISSIDEVAGDITGVSLEYAGDEARAAAVLADINECFAGRARGFQNLGSVDIVADGCSKGSGVSFVRDYFGLDTVVGIGDSYNDLTLLAAADVSYTFHTSPTQVRGAADHVVDLLAEALADFLD